MRILLMHNQLTLLKVLSYWNLNGEELQEQLKEMIFLKYYHIGI